MAVQIDRSMNDDLIEGSTDGVIKKPRPDTGNITNDASQPAREALFNGINGYNIPLTEQEREALAHGIVRGA